MSFVKMEGLRKTFGDIVAVRDFSLDIDEGEFVAVLGPSGSGKTTLLKIIAGFETPDEGDLVVDGESMLGLEPEDREMGMVFQRLALFPHMTVHQNIAFGLQMRTDLSADEISQRVSEVLDLIELPGYGDRNVTELSGGEQQRVALARAIVIEPKVLLFDEPLSDLDRQLREHMRREIADIHKELGITSIYVTHNQREALTLADRVVVMRDGDLVQVDAPSELYRSPNSAFVSQFVGDSNVIRGAVASNENGTWFESGPVDLPLDNGAPEGPDVTLFARPEDLSLGRSGTDEQTFPCRIATVTHLGSITEYLVEVEGDDGSEELLVADLGTPAYEQDEVTTVSFEQYDVIGSEADG